jgi:hypothetical protein
MFSFFTSSSDMPRRATLGRMVSQSTALLMVCVGALILVLALLILFHENANATKGYSLRKLESQRSVLLLEQEVLNMQIAEAQALEKLQKDPQVQAMVPFTKPKYVQEESPVAMRKPQEEAKSWLLW